MPQIIINHKICDRAPECGGIAVCPRQAIYYDKDTKSIAWDESKCTFCLQCALPDSCPVGAIMYAADELQAQSIQNTINEDPHSDEWLWLERYGVMPSESDPKAKILNNQIFDTIKSKGTFNIIDIWHEDFLECRLHSPLYADIFIGVNNCSFFKLDAKKYSNLVQSLSIDAFPSLIALKDGEVIYQHQGIIKPDQIEQINQKLQKLSNY